MNETDTSGADKLLRDFGQKKKTGEALQRAGFDTETATDLAHLTQMLLTGDEEEDVPFAKKFLGDITKLQLSQAARGQEIAPEIREQMATAAKKYREWLFADD